MTRRANRSGLAWVLSGAAFVAGVLVIAGCHSGTMTYEPEKQQKVAPAWKVAGVGPTAQGEATASNGEKPSFDVFNAEPTPPKVNVFGEFDGVQCPTAKKSGGEAGFQQHTFIEDGYDGDVSVDPKGQWIVFASTRHSEHPDIYLQKVDGISVTQLTSDEADDAFPTFSPDGKRIAFCSTRAGNWDIYLTDIDGHNTVQITNSPMQELHPSFSPDGTRLAYCAMSSRSGQWELWTVNLLNGEKRMIGFGLFPTWSPSKDKDEIAYQKSRARGSRWFSLWTLDLVDGEARRVTEVAVSTNAAIVSPSWSPDGRHLSFSTIVEPAKTDASHTTPVGQQDIWTIDVDGTNRHRITDGNGICATPYWAKDNRIYFVSDRSGSECIWSAKAEGGNISTANTETKELAN